MLRKEFFHICVVLTTTLIMLGQIEKIVTQQQRNTNQALFFALEIALNWTKINTTHTDFQMTTLASSKPVRSDFWFAVAFNNKPFQMV